MRRYDAERQRWVEDEGPADGGPEPGPGGTDGAGHSDPSGHTDQAARTGRTDKGRTVSGRRQRQVILSAFAVLLCAGIAFPLVKAAGSDDETADGAPGPQPTVTVTASQNGTDAGTETGGAGGTYGPSVSASPSALAAAPPSGYRRVHDEEGFTADVPEDWKRSQPKSGVVFYETADRSRQVQFFWVEDPSPYASIQLAEDIARDHPGYQRIGLDRMGEGDDAAVRLEYTYDSKKQGGTRHVIDHRFVAADGQPYAILAIGPDEDGGTRESDLLDAALSSFCPAAAECATQDAD